jgi:hypothetical protein
MTFIFLLGNEPGQSEKLMQSATIGDTWLILLGGAGFLNDVALWTQQMRFHSHEMALRLNVNLNFSSSVELVCSALQQLPSVLCLKSWVFCPRCEKTRNILFLRRSKRSSTLACFSE